MTYGVTKPAKGEGFQSMAAGCPEASRRVATASTH